jgi:hypothetical protein
MIVLASPLMRPAALLLLTLCLCAGAVADELILVPVWYDGPGDNGSHWTTHLSVYNDTRYYLQADERGVLPCQWLMTPCPRGFWGNSMIVYQATEPVSGGFTMTVPDQFASDLHFTLRTFERGAWREDLGTDLPVVREGDFRRGPVQIMNIPSSDPAAFRYTLRVYAHGHAIGPRVRINGYLTMADGQPDLVLTATVPLMPVYRGVGHFYFEDATFVRDLVNIAGSMGKLRVELEPLSPNMRWWGMVSSTNNRSGDVTIVTPN